MKKLLLLFSMLAVMVSAQAQTYSPTLSTTSINKPMGANGYPLDARSYFYNSTKFLFRPYISTAEVLSYLASPLNRTGQFSIIINTGGTLNQTTGVLVGGTNAEWWFKDGVANNNLVLKSSSVSTSGIYNYVPLLVFTGESNAAGAVRSEYLNAGDQQTKTRVMMFNNKTRKFEPMQIPINSSFYVNLDNRFGWELEVANMVASGKIKSDTIYIVKVAYAGATIGQLTSMIDSARSRLGAASKQLYAKGKVPQPYYWYSQGINDGGAGTPVSTWKANTKTYWKSVRGIGGPGPMFVTQNITYGVQYNDAIKSLVAADSLAYYISTAGATIQPGEENHWSKEGMALIANRMVDTMYNYFSTDAIYNARSLGKARQDSIGTGNFIPQFANQAYINNLKMTGVLDWGLANNGLPKVVLYNGGNETALTGAETSTATAALKLYANGAAGGENSEGILFGVGYSGETGPRKLDTVTSFMRIDGVGRVRIPRLRLGYIDGNLFLPADNRSFKGALAFVEPLDNFTIDGVVVPNYGMKGAFPMSTGSPTWMYSASAFRWHTNSGERMRLTSAGGLYLGYTDDPFPVIGYKFAVNGNMYVGGTLDAMNISITADVGKIAKRDNAGKLFATNLYNIRIDLTSPPSPTSAGVKGDVYDDATGHYVCIATNTWKRTLWDTTF